MGAGNPRAQGMFSNTMAQNADPQMAQAWGMGQNIMGRMAGMAPNGQGPQQQQIQSALSRMKPPVGNKPRLPIGSFKQRTPGVRY